ncbi:MAG: glycosyltransferase family 4 protein [Bacteroidota bacterium]
MRIACYGLVDQAAGSVSSANYYLLDELLQRGHQIDFYAKKDYVHPERLFHHEGFTYHGVLLEDKVAKRARIPAVLDRALHRAIEEWLYRAHLEEIAVQIARDHRLQPFDLLLFLGVGALFEGPGMPVVSWVQGPPQTEWRAIERLRPQIQQLCGRMLYTKLRVFYAYKQRAARRELARTDHVICGSPWARQHVIDFGVAPARVHALPYPIDLELFRPEEQAPLHAGRHTLLWLGRIDPRKRLDLMLDGFKLLLDERRDVHLELIGRLNYAPEYGQLIRDFPYPDHLTYRDAIQRDEVPDLLNRVAVAVQPSEDENFGSTVAEALCCGTPVVMGPTNGTAAYGGEASFLFESYTPGAVKHALAEALEALARRPDELRATARQTAEEAFDTRRVVDQLEAVCRDAISQSAGPQFSISTRTS